MTYLNRLAKNKTIVIALFLYIALYFYNNSIFFKALDMTFVFIKEMLQVMPPILIISALITTWVPSKVIMKNFGTESGLKGKFISIFIGSISAGPIYAAFPVAQSLFYKGASISNIVIIISSWAVIKIPMLIVETNFLGIKFAASRYILTIPTILLLGYLMDKLIDKSDIPEEKIEKNLTVKDVYTKLPQLNCGGCSYPNCKSFAEAVVTGETNINKCVIKENATNN